MYQVKILKHILPILRKYMECQALKLVKQSLKNSNMHDHNFQEQLDVWRRNFSYETTVRLWECRKKSNVYDECDRGNQFQFPQSDEKRRLSKRERLIQITIFTLYRT